MVATPASNTELQWRDGATLPDALLPLLHPARSRLWTVERELWTPRTAVLVRDGAPVAALLTAGRPLTRYRKIVDVIAGDLDAFAEVLRLTIASPEKTGPPPPLLLRFEEHPHLAPLTAPQMSVLADLGFSRRADPFPSVPSTVPDHPDFTRAWDRWCDGRVPRSSPYYGQTTDVTCGAVAALLAGHTADMPSFDEDRGRNHSRELDFWRRATNLPACEPVGLAVATAEQFAGWAVTPRVVLSAAHPVLLEDWQHDPAELRLREQLQAESWRAAERLGIEIERRWIEVAELRELIVHGAVVLLLIDLEPLAGDANPHWVLAHDVVDDALLVSDPWVEADHGESWVDCAAVPLPLAAVDRVLRWGQPPYRGAVVLR